MQREALAHARVRLDLHDGHLLFVHLFAQRIAFAGALLSTSRHTPFQAQRARGLLPVLTVMFPFGPPAITLPLGR
jgi:hypothetical protein